MTVFKCKMCGGTLEINNETVFTCEYCGTKQTLPKLDDEKRSQMYDRANHFRRNNEFDKAMGIYEQILNEDNTDAEAYWSLVLCRYGIEYVEDPASHKRIPTVNRAQFTSIFDDDNYKSALRYADGFQRSLYEEEANAINEIQKGILSISQKEEPFDVFICYKETDESGRRTPDSVLANDLYYQLTEEGFKVFFARITLEDKLGSAYEPYIFAALNSAKVMVALGTKQEHFNAVWVKNEWSRYLALIKNGADKMLIPAYRDMDPYDLPEEFSHLQAQDMSKLGFMQDLIHGIKKIVHNDDNKNGSTAQETIVPTGNINTAPLLKRAFMFLEDGDWKSADEYCEKVLDIEPECAEAYLGKLMATCRVRKKENLKDCSSPFDGSVHYEKIRRFGNDVLKAKLEEDLKFIRTRNENARLEEQYTNAVRAMKVAETEENYKKAAEKFAKIPEYKDSDRLQAECLEKAEDARKDAIFDKGVSKMHEGARFGAGDHYQAAISLFQSIPGWKNAEEKIAVCEKHIREIEEMEEAKRLERERRAVIEKAEAEARAKRNKKIVMSAIPVICVLIAFWILWVNVIQPSVKYNKALTLMENGNVIEAYEAFIALDGYKDSKEKAGSIFAKYEVEKLKAAKVGDYVKFGSYEQDNNAENGKEEIEWLVLDKQDSKALVISKYALDCKQYNTDFTGVTWETCTLRKWLNNDFLGAAFSTDEKAMIPTVTVSADKNPKYSTNPGNATQDQVFLLSITEVNKYFSSDGAIQCKPTAYAVANGASVKSDNGNCWWWLRSPGDFQDCAATVNYGGAVYEYAFYVHAVNSAVRPALWIDLG